MSTSKTGAPDTEWVLSLLCGLASTSTLMKAAKKIGGKNLQVHQELQALMRAVGGNTFMKAAEETGKEMNGCSRDGAAEQARRLIREGKGPSQKPLVCSRFLRSLAAGMNPEDAYREAHLGGEM